MADALDDLLALMGVRRLMLEASLGRQVAKVIGLQAELHALDIRLADLDGVASELRDESFRREREEPAATHVVRASIDAVHFRRPLVAGQRHAAAAVLDAAAARVATTNQALIALGERDAEYRRMAQRASLFREASADDDEA